MARLSTEITGKIRSALFLLAALTEQGPMVAELVVEKYRASLAAGDQPAGLLTQIRTLGQILKAALDLMVELDRNLYDEDELRATRFKEREDLGSELSLRVSGVRRIVTGHYRAPKVGKIGLEGRLAREPIALIRQTELICERLRRDNLEQLLGDPLFEPPYDPRLCVPQIELVVEDLRQAFEIHQRSRRRVDKLLARKQEAVAEYDVVSCGWRGSSRIFAGWPARTRWPPRCGRR